VALTRDDARTLLGAAVIPNRGPSAERNPMISASTAFQNFEIILRRMEQRLAAQDAVMAKLVDALGQGGSFDPETLKAEIRQAIESVSVQLSVD
jgi:hypothetical protein